MKTALDRVSFLKYVDLVIQFFAFAVMLLLIGFSDCGPFAFFVEAGVQVASCLLWSLYFYSGVPQHRWGVLIRRIFAVVLVTWILLSLIPAIMFTILCIMLLAGPLLGCAYFIITALEAAYYRKARKPYYLL